MKRTLIVLLLIFVLFVPPSLATVLVVKTGEYANIPAALAVPPSPGDTIDVQEDQVLSSYVNIGGAVINGSSGSPITLMSTNGSSITAPSGGAAFYVNAADYIVFKDLRVIAHASGSTRGVNLANSAAETINLEVDNCYFEGFSQGGVSWLVSNANASIMTSPTVKNSTFKECGSLGSTYAAVDFRTEAAAVNAVLTNATATGNTFIDCPYIGIRFFGEGVFATYGWSGGVLIANNTYTNCFGGTAIGGFGSSGYGENLIYGNSSTGMTGAAGGVDLFYSQYVDIYDEDHQDSTTDTIDGNGILVDKGNQHVRIRDSLINNMLGKSGVAWSGAAVMVLDSQDVTVSEIRGSGNKCNLYFGDTGDISISDIDVTNITLTEAVDYGIYLSTGLDATDLAEIKLRNIISTGDGSGVDIQDETTGGGSFDEDYNSHYNFSTSNEAGAHNVTGDPLVDAFFSIPKTSPCRNAGDNSVVDASTRVIWGGTVDIGAFEYEDKILTIGR
jgi:uncharacterized protein YneR